MRLYVSVDTARPWHITEAAVVDAQPVSALCGKRVNPAGVHGWPKSRVQRPDYVCADCAGRVPVNPASIQRYMTGARVLLRQGRGKVWEITGAVAQTERVLYSLRNGTMTRTAYQEQIAGEAPRA